MRSIFLLFFCLLLLSYGSSTVITGTCDRDSQCGEGMCCAVSLWISTLRVCTPMGKEGDACHPLSHEAPFVGRRLHHICPCQPHLTCLTVKEGQSKCFSPYQLEDYFL